MAGESAQSKAIHARQKAERLTRYAEAWEKGALGESRTAQALAELGPEWTVWHDLKWPGRRYANIDHLVIGPGGIFVVDSKNWSGSITVKDGVLRQNGRRREPAVAGCADSAIAVGELTPRYLDRVRPVLCFTRDEVIAGWARDVMLCSTSNVVAMLQSREPVLNVDEVADAVISLHATMNSQSPVAAPFPDTSAPSTRDGSWRRTDCLPGASPFVGRGSTRPARLHRLGHGVLRRVRATDP